jgi:tRNA(Ile)-lysidine synthetase-like protein
MTLLALLGRDRDPARDPVPVAAHFDHGTRGAGSAGDGRFVAAVARRWGVDARLGRGRAPERAAETGEGPMAAARVLRYRFLARVAREVGATAIVTAQHRDDRVETVLQRIVRGASPDGLAGPAPIEIVHGVTLLRPLLPFTRRAIAEWAEAAGVPFRDDPSNKDPRYPRTRVREEVLPLLTALNPRVDQAVVRLASLAAEDAAFLGERTEELLEAATVERGRQVWRFEAKHLVGAPSALLSRALLRAWASCAARDTPSPGAEWVAGAMRFVRGGRGGRIAGPGGVTLLRRGGRIEVSGNRKDDDG